jgi:hypothetical protein
MSLLQPARWSCGECCPAHGAQSKTLPRVEPAEVETNHRPPPSDPQSSFELVLSSLTLFAPFIYKMHYFTKTGSGQT